MVHKPAAELRQSLVDAAAAVVIGGEYRHYRQPGSYIVSALVIVEDSEGVAVAYHPAASPDITFIRPLESWLATVEHAGQIVPRFMPLG